MKNTYLVIGAVVVVAIIGLFWGSKRSQAPVSDNMATSTDTYTLADGSYRIDTGLSKISLTAEEISGAKIEGTGTFSSGSLSVASGAVSGGSFSINIVSPKTEQTAIFDIKTVEPSSKYTTDPANTRPGSYVVGGNLTVGSSTQPISFMADISSLNGNQIKAYAYFVLNMAEWGLNKNSALKNAIEVTLDITASRE